MPRGPQGQWRPRGDNECAALVCRIATGESPEVFEPPERSAEEQQSVEDRASKGGKARAAKLTPARRREIAATGAAARKAPERA